MEFTSEFHGAIGAHCCSQSWPVINSASDWIYGPYTTALKSIGVKQQT